MKKLACLFATVVALMSVTSCNKDTVFGDGEDWFKPATADTTKTTPDTTKTTPDTTKIVDDPYEIVELDSVNWGCIVERTFYYDETTDKWPSRLTFHTTGGRDTTFLAYCPMESKISAPAEVLVDSTASETRFVNVDSQVEIDSTNWVQNPVDGFYYRTIKRRYNVHMNNYDAVVTSTHVEAKMIRAGKEIVFLFGREQSPYIVDDSSSDNGEVGRQGKTYKVELSHLKMSQLLHGYTYADLESYTRVLREKSEVVTPDPEPTADFEIPGLQRFMSASRVWNEDERHYCDVYTFECTESYFFIVVNFSYNKKDDKEKQTGIVTKTVEKSSVYYNEKYASAAQGCAVYDHGSYLPAIYSWDSTGFTVMGAHSDRSTVKQEIFDTDAVNRGIKNMKENDNAKPTPIIYQRSCTVGNNGVWTVVGRTDGHTISFTVKSK